MDNYVAQDPEDFREYLTDFHRLAPDTIIRLIFDLDNHVLESRIAGEGDPKALSTASDTLEDMFAKFLDSKKSEKLSAQKMAAEFAIVLSEVLDNK